MGDAMKETQTMVEEFVERLQKAAGTNLESLILYGSVSVGSAQDKYSDVNLLCILHEAAAAELARLAPAVEWWAKKAGERPPLVFTAEELRTSADVFAIELLDMKAQHRVLAGSDVLASIDVPMNLHRVQVEHDLRTLHLRLRQHFLLYPENERELQRVLAKSVSSTLTLLRHALIVLGKGVAPLTGKRDVIACAGEAFHVETAPFLAALELRENGHSGRRIEETYQEYLQTLATIVHRIDEAAPKKQWHKAVS
jgi:hypothetical protein